MRKDTLTVFLLLSLVLTTSAFSQSEETDVQPPSVPAKDALKKIQQIAETNATGDTKGYDEALRQMYEVDSKRYGYWIEKSGSQNYVPKLTADNKLEIVEITSESSSITGTPNKNFPDEAVLPYFKVDKNKTTTTHVTISKKDGSYNRDSHEKSAKSGDIYLFDADTYKKYNQDQFKVIQKNMDSKTGPEKLPVIKDYSNLASDKLASSDSKNESVKLAFDHELGIVLGGLKAGVSNGQIPKDRLKDAVATTSPSKTSMFFGTNSKRVNELVKYIVMGALDDFTDPKFEKECRAKAYKELTADISTGTRLLLLSDKDQLKFFKKFLQAPLETAIKKAEKNDKEFKRWMNEQGPVSAERKEELMSLYVIKNYSDVMWEPKFASEEKMSNWIDNQKVDETKLFAQLSANNPNLVNQIKKQCALDGIQEMSKKDLTEKERKQLLDQLYGIMFTSMKEGEACSDTVTCLGTLNSIPKGPSSAVDLCEEHVK